MNERAPKTKQELQAELDVVESRVHALSDYLDGKVSQIELDFINETWGAIVQGTPSGKVPITEQTIKAMEDVYAELVDLAEKSKITLPRN